MDTRAKVSWWPTRKSFKFESTNIQSKRLRHMVVMIKLSRYLTFLRYTVSQYLGLVTEKKNSSVTLKKKPYNIYNFMYNKNNLIPLILINILQSCHTENGPFLRFSTKSGHCFYNIFLKINIHHDAYDISEKWLKTVHHKINITLSFGSALIQIIVTVVFGCASCQSGHHRT